MHQGGRREWEGPVGPGIDHKAKRTVRNQAWAPLELDTQAATEAGQWERPGQGDTAIRRA